MTLRITITEERDTVIMAPAGRIDSSSLEELQEGLKQVKEIGKGNIVFLLRDLEYINTRGIGELRSFSRGIRDEGGVVSLADVPPNILRELNLFGFEDLAQVYGTLPEALENSSGRNAEAEGHEEPGQFRDLPFLDTPVSKNSSNVALILAGSVLVIVAILVYLFFKPAGRQAGPGAEWAAKWDVLDRRIARLEMRDRSLSQLEEKLEKMSSSTSERLNALEKEWKGFKESLEMEKRKQTAAASVPKEPTEPPKAVYVVSKGDTLFSIARRHGMTVDEVRRLNNLNADQSIFPGQKLLVRNEKPN